MKRVVFMGTSAFAVPILETLAAHYEIPLVITQPDRPSGRGRGIHQPPVKQAALRLGISVFQPEKIREEAAVQRLVSLQPIDAIVVAAFGQIVPKVILDMPELGCINVHASLLPKYRGAAPIQHALIAGETRTGVTTMLMDPGLDTGDILMQREIEIDPTDNAGTLTEKLAALGAEMIVPTLEGLQNGTVKPIPQDHSKATEARSLKHEAGELDFSRSSEEIAARVRGVTPEPGAYVVTPKGLLKVWQVEPVSCPREGARPGQIVEVTGNGVVIAAGVGCVTLKEVQPESRRRMSGADYARGSRLKQGDKLVVDS